MQKALYLFCVARAGLLPDLSVDGLCEGSTVLHEDFAGITAVCCEVPLDEFSGPSAESRLQDLTWVAPRALKHGEVIQRVMEYSPVLPARFGTLFFSAQSLRRLFERNISEIDEYLDRVADRDEWAVKGVMSRTKLRERLGSKKIARQQQLLSSIPPGMRYFKERQLMAEVDRDLGGWIKDLCRGVATRLTERSTDWHRRDIVVRSKEESGEETFLNWAFLVDREQAGEFESRLLAVNQAYNPYGVHFDLSGPWPPYSFAPVLEMAADS